MIKKDFETWHDKTKCPLCMAALVKKYEGMVCQNFCCPLYFKLGGGWVFLNKEKEKSLLFHQSKYYSNPESFFNKRRWLELKSEILYERGKCENCSSNICLHVHHILPRHSHPELGMDKENLMVLCEDCHKKIHSEDKHRYS
jgi:5-methylcytosine-specific restriction endonuclease McrA